MSIRQEPGVSPSVRPPLTELPPPVLASGVAVAPPAAFSPIREFLNSRGSGRLADTSFSAVMLICACSIFVIVLFIFSLLILRSHLSLAAFGWKFFTRQAWDPVAGDFGALPFIYETLVTSMLALVIAVPLALGV